MRLTVVVDNNTCTNQYYCGEPAACYYIETGDKRILFDTGYSDLLLKNAERLKIDLSNLTQIVLSHGHDDHTNGLKYLEETVGLSRVELISHPDCFLPKYTGDGAFLGAPYTRDEVTQKTNYHPCRTFYKITDDLIFLGEIPRTTDFEARNPIGKLRQGENWVDDYAKDDTALAYRTSRGIFIITGCSHSGICNIIEYAKAVCNDQRVLGALGGFHLLTDDDRLEKTIQYVEKNQIAQLYPCHCVSLLAKAKMMAKLPVFEVGVGTTISLP